MTFNFGEILTRAWQIIWKHKVLWIFGIFAGCTQGGGGGGGGSGGGGGGGGSDGPTSPEVERFFENVSQWVSDNTWIVVLIVVIVVLVWLALIFLGTIGRIGLIRGTLQAEAGADSLSFGALFSESLPYFWRVFGLVLLVGLAFLVVLLPLVLFGVLTAGVGFICALPLICVLIPVGWMVAAVVEQSNVAIVKEDLRTLDGLRRGWEIVKNNLVSIIVMGLILFGLAFVFGFIMAIPVFLIVFPAILAMGLSEGQNMTPLYVAGLCFVAYLPVLIVLQGILSAYIESAWTLTYLRLTGPRESLPAQANA